MTVTTTPVTRRAAGGLRVAPAAAGPPGAHRVEGGVRFSVSAPGAAAVRLVLLDPADGRPAAELDFPQSCRTGDSFAMTVSGLPPGPVHYGYRVLRAAADGTPVPGPVLLDPYATATAGAEHWGARHGPGPRHRSLVPAAPEPGGGFDWGEDPRPRTAPGDLVIYELHVRGFTRHPSSGITAPGTYEGLRQKVPYLRGLGVTCVELLPVAEFDETDNTYLSPATGQPLLNFWGYNPVALLAPKAGYAAAPHRAADELKALVKDLHLAGIEVILDVVLNHTAEGDHRGPTLSFRGLDEAGFYLLGPDGAPVDLTATGNTVNANHPRTRRFLVDCLRHWATEFHVDGFRFDMAPILARGLRGELLDHPPLLAEIAADPVLAHCRLIAEPTDATGLDQVGTFPGGGRWAEWNGRYRDAVRGFLTGRPGSAGELATRLAGSPDLYPGRGPAVSVNYVTCHDGLTLADWASYDRRHNEANGEGGADGIPDEVSWNHGHEGPTGDPDVTALRARQMRNAFALLAVSAGVPMLTAGDEFARTQHGNNNAYCQDNETGWVDWRLAQENAGLHEFVRRCLAFRRAHPVLRRNCHPDGRTPPGAPLPPVSWHGTEPGRPDWSPDSRLVAMLVHHQEPGGPGDTVYLAAGNGPGPVTVTVPEPPPGTRWHLFADTAAADGTYAHPPGREPPLAGAGRLTVAPYGAVVLTAHPYPEGPASPTP